MEINKVILPPSQTVTEATGWTVLRMKSGQSDFAGLEGMLVTDTCNKTGISALIGRGVFANVRLGVSAPEIFPPLIKSPPSFSPLITVNHPKQLQ